MSIRRFIAGSLLPWLCCVLWAAGASADEFEPVREKIRAALVKHNVPSLAVAVARDGQIVWEQGFGWADREHRVPADEHTMYSLASISKPVTATGLAVLVERGRIDLDHPINEYLGDARLTARVGKAKDATVRRVANHSAGLPLHYQFFYEDQPYRRPPMDETIRRYGNLVTAPGERFEYSNLGYGVLDYVIARVSGKSYPDFMREEVFVPLGLSHTSVNVAAGLEKYEAVRYGPDGQRIPFYDFDHPGASAVYSSAHDLVRFGLFHVGDRQSDQREIISDALRKKMQEPTFETQPGGGYGLGWTSAKLPGGATGVAHSGGMAGVATMLTLVPEKRLVIVVLSNASTAVPGAIANQILQIVLPPPEPVADAPKTAEANGKPATDAASPQPAGPEPPKPDPVEAVKTLAGRWKGTVHTYQQDLPITLEVQPDGDVHVQFEGQLKTLLNSARLQDGYLRGRMLGDLKTEDTARTPYVLHLEVKHRDNVLNGSLTAISKPVPPRVGNALTHWIELRKQAD